MTIRCHHCRARLTQGELNWYGDSCNACEEAHMRRRDDQYPNRPSKFAQRVAVLMAIAIIVLCVVGVKVLGSRG
ncbi:hypothetical protein [Dyella japonica]|uniref:Uncharacterized protein n=1 Tax=Dyella japonica TaxID=231455 RepID=A0ABV2K1Y8_9GAMM